MRAGATGATRVTGVTRVTRVTGAIRGMALASVVVLGGALGGCTGSAAGVGGRSPVPPPPALAYRLFVTNESSDIVSRVVFDPVHGARVEGEIPVGFMSADTDAPHGVAVDPAGEYLYVTIAHGTPDGWLWKLRADDGSVVARTTLGRFPASVGTSPDGRFVFVVNFNLHGDMVPSDLSVIFAPDLREVARITSCLMPHGSRTSVSGSRHYHVCMHSDQLVELSLATFAISNRFSLAPEHEMRLEPDDTGPLHEGHDPGQVCSPTWVVPAEGVGADRFVYVACNASNEVVEVDVLSWAVTRRFGTGARPYNLDISPDGRLIVVTLKGGAAVNVIDLESAQLLAELPTTREITHGVVISPDGRYAFVTNESIGGLPGTLDVFDLAALERVSSVELRLQPGGVDLWRVDPIGEGPLPEGPPAGRFP